MNFTPGNEGEGGREGAGHTKSLLERKSLVNWFSQLTNFILTIFTNLVKPQVICTNILGYLEGVEFRRRLYRQATPSTLTLRLIPHNEMLSQTAAAQGCPRGTARKASDSAFSEPSASSTEKPFRPSGRTAQQLMQTGVYWLSPELISLGVKQALRERRERKEVRLVL